MVGTYENLQLPSDSSIHIYFLQRLDKAVKEERTVREELLILATCYNVSTDHKYARIYDDILRRVEKYEVDSWLNIEKVYNLIHSSK